MANIIKTKRGLDILMSGFASRHIAETIISETITIIPDDFHGIVPKVIVKEGDVLKAGTPVFYNKNFESMKFVSPVSGTVLAVNRGERRKVLSITIACDKSINYEHFEFQPLEQTDGDTVKKLLLSAGLWPYIKQRPYDLIANPDKTPKSIFISGFDSAPLAPDYDFVIGGQLADFQKGLDALAKLTSGKIYLGVKADSVLSACQNVDIKYFEGPHPVGNVGVQINKIDPVNKGEVVWTVNAQDVLFIGRFFNKAVVDLTRTVAVTGPEVLEPRYHQTIAGTQILDIVKQNIAIDKRLRFINGNVLSGFQVDAEGSLNPYATHISVIKEGDDIHEMLGWAMPRFDKFSVSGVYFTSVLRKLFGKKEFDFDARILGGKRAIIMSGEYDKVLPMDILPEFLIKAMIAGNIDKMEALGAYEVAPEDFALCEFVCTSKLPVQQIVRQALDNMQKELE